MAHGLVSVIVPAYNEASRVGSCLDSICAQTYTNIEILCVNDGSTDDTLSILRDYESKDSRIIVIDQENQGQGASRNHAIARSRGEYIVGVDADDAVLPDMIEKALSCIEDDIDIVCFNTKLEQDKEDEDFLQQKVIYYRNNFEGKVAVCEDCINRTSVNFWNKLWRASLIKENNVQFGAAVYEDMVFFVCACVHARNLYYLNEELCIHRLRSGSIMDRTFTRTSLMPLDLMVCLEEIHAHLKEHEMLDQWKSLFLYTFKRLFRSLRRWLPADSTSMAVSVANYVARKIKLTELCDEDPELQRLLSWSNLLKTEWLERTQVLFDEYSTRYDEHCTKIERLARSQIKQLQSAVSDAETARTNIDQRLNKHEELLLENMREHKVTRSSTRKQFSALTEELAAQAKKKQQEHSSLRKKIEDLSNFLNSIEGQINGNGKEIGQVKQELVALKQSFLQSDKQRNETAKKHHRETLLLQQGLLFRCQYYYYRLASFFSWGKRKNKHIHKVQKLQALLSEAVEIRRKHFKY